MKHLIIRLISILLFGFILSSVIVSTSCEIIDDEENQDDITDDNQNDNTGTFTDIRDGRIYNWVKIGDQVWMAENLDYYPIGLGTAWVSNGNNSNRELYGLLYSKDIALQIAPDGWHLPSVYEWERLEIYIGEQGFNDDEAYALKSQIGWYNMGNGIDYFGFKALPAGGYSSPYESWAEYVLTGESCLFWIRTVTNNDPGYVVYLDGNDSKINYGQVDINDGISIRSIKD